ncbi:alkaline phosphatase family protein [Candidatus Poribacteria bacterium]|nr:alkaline phosphatase family protein [Candidatus Poribacteria bacterium]
MDHMNINKKRRVFVLGIDGATFDLIKPWAREGKLPSFKKMFETGAHGDLRSVPSCRSAAAWTSLITGTNPGKHGIYEFYEYVPEKCQVKFINASFREGDSIWKRCSDAGKVVGVINVPMTYPAERVNGILVGGIDTPGTESKGFTYPRDFAEKLKQRYGEYIIEPGLTGFIVGNKIDLAARKLEEETLQKVDLSKYMMSLLDWDFFMVVFRSVDAAQHCFWKYMDRSHPHFNEKEHRKYGDTILSTYQKIDDFLGFLLETLDEETTLIIMSDHGFGKKHPAGNQVNMWLRKMGWLKFKTDTEAKTGSSRLGSAFTEALGVLYRLVIGLTPRKFKEALARRFPNLRNKVTSRLCFSEIDWSVTSAYSESVFPTVRINLKGREKDGTVEPGPEFDSLRERIRRELLENCRDSATGEQIVSQVLRKEDIYTGKYVCKAPDLLIKWKEDSRINGIDLGDGTRRGSIPLRVSSYKSFITGEDPDVISGDHHTNGIFMIRGKKVCKGYDIGTCEFLDLTPTIYHLLDLPIPSDFDGKPLLKAFEGIAGSLASSEWVPQRGKE